MERLPFVRGKGKVAFDHQALRNRRIAREAELGRDCSFVHLAVAGKSRLLAMECDPPPRDGAILQRSPHQPGRRDGHAVVGEARGTCDSELAHLGELRSQLSLGDRREESDRNLRFDARSFDERAERRRRVHDRIGVRHREDRAVAARRRGRGAGRDVLLVLTSGRAQVHVRVDEGRRQQQAFPLDHPVRVRVELGAERRDHAVVDSDVEQRVDACDRIEDTGAANDDVLLRLL